MAKILRNVLATAAVSLLVSAAHAGPTPPTFHGEALPPVGNEQPSRVVPKPVADPCAASVSERDGIVTLLLDDPARTGLQTTFVLDDIRYAAHFDERGRLEARGPLLHGAGDLEWTGLAGQSCREHAIPFGDYEHAVATALVWPAGTVDLALHIVEPPGGRLGGVSGYITPGRPNLDHASGLGQILSFGEPVTGTSQAQVYSLAPDRNPRAGDLYAFVEFVTRGNPAQPPFCGTDPRAVASYKVLHLDHGRLERRGGTFGAVACGTAWSEAQKAAEYFQRWKWKL